MTIDQKYQQKGFREGFSKEYIFVTGWTNYLTVVKMDSCVESLFLVYICLNNGNKILPADVIKGRVYLWLSKNE